MTIPRMALLERTRAGKTELWAAEVCGAEVCIRQGKAGGKGRISSIRTPSEGEARAALEQAIADRLGDGYEVVDPNAGISGPFRSRAQRDEARARGATSTPGAILRRLEAQLAGVVSLGSLAELVCQAAEAPCVARLSHLELDLREGERRGTFELGWVQGRGPNPDDYEHEQGRVSFLLAAPWPRRDDGVTVDVFADGLRSLGARALAAKWRAALEQLPAWAELARSSVSEVELADPLG